MNKNNIKTDVNENEFFLVSANAAHSSEVSTFVHSNKRSKILIQCFPARIITRLSKEIRNISSPSTKKILCWLQKISTLKTMSHYFSLNHYMTAHAKLSKV